MTLLEQWRNGERAKVIAHLEAGLSRKEYLLHKRSLAQRVVDLYMVSDDIEAERVLMELES